MQRVFLVHGWGGSPEGDWMPWAKREIEKLGYEVFVSKMPDTENPKIDPWLNTLSKTIGVPKKDDILIGHSIGTLAIIRYLQTLNKGEIIGKVILIAPWQTLTLDENEDPKIAEPWQVEDIDYDKIKTKAKSFVAVFSKDDPWVPFEENKKYFAEKLDPEIVVKDKMGHFNMQEIPFLINLIK